MTPCDAPECQKRVHARGMCHTHYTAWRRGAGPEATRKRPTPAVALRRNSVIGPADKCWEWTGPTTMHGYGYAYCALDGVAKNHGAHRIAYRLSIGPIAPGMVIDHMCHNRLCVNPSHLRQITRGQNIENREGPQENNTSGYRGVTFHRPSGKWMAQAHHLGKHHCGGYFNTAEDAALAAIELRNRIFSCNIEKEIADARNDNYGVPSDS